MTDIVNVDNRLKDKIYAGDYITFEIPFSELLGLDGELFGE